MKYAKLKERWLESERKSFKGWDFSLISSRMKEASVPWDYRESVLNYMSGESTVMLDMGTGGGEFLLSLNPPRGRTYATESYVPNAELCRNLLPSHGIEFRQVFGDEQLPFENDFFDLVINRHESFCAEEVARILKPGGLFVTQQVGGANNRELSKFVLDGGGTLTDSDFHLQRTAGQLVQAGMTIVEGKEAYPLLTFSDVEAFVYFAKVIEWEFPGFSVETCYSRLCLLQEQIERQGCFHSVEHRFFIIAQKGDLT
ncbi:class I SAM-dependent methyltransferase [Paenibacillus sp. M.A.Huq-81]